MRLFIGDFQDNSVILKEEEEHHIIKVLRMSVGDEIYVTDGAGNLVRGTLDIRGKKALVNVSEIFPKEKPKERNLHIAIAPTKNLDRFEFFIEKAVEFGISEITPILCANSERKVLKEEKIYKQVEGACKQSLQTIFPKVNTLTPLKTLVDESDKPVYVAHCYKEYIKKPLAEVISENKNLLLLIGPEGDFSKKEIEYIMEVKGAGVDLGSNRLRTETAGLLAASAFYFSGL